ncbi:hypothetical protein SAM9427_06110 [Streptomyces sp. ETH9427]|nr:hypothetical protein SAM9427_06110 [Streptomyces sp. ETH9427]
MYGEALLRDGRAKRRVVALGSAGVLVTTALMAGAVAAPGASATADTRRPTPTCSPGSSTAPT